MAENAWKIIPYLLVDNAPKAIDFYVRALGAKETMRHPMPDGRIGHAELDLHGATIYLADDPSGAGGAKMFENSPVIIHVELPDVDAVFARAVDAGATISRPVADQFYGDRNGGFIDPFGHHWYVSTHIRDVSEAEIREATKAALASHST